MIWTQRIVLILMGLALLGLTLELIRKRRLREEYAVLWVCTGLMLLGFAVMDRALVGLAGWLHLENATLLALLCFVFLAAIVLHYSVVISRHSEREKSLAQELALLKDELEKVRAATREAPTPPAEAKPRPPALRT